MRKASLLQHRSSQVRRPIVNDNYVHPVNCLRQYAVDSLSNRGGAVVGLKL